jgi:hypothetical protein
VFLVVVESVDDLGDCLLRTLGVVTMFLDQDTVAGNVSDYSVRETEISECFEGVAIYVEVYFCLLLNLL